MMCEVCMLLQLYKGATLALKITLPQILSKNMANSINPPLTFTHILPDEKDIIVRRDQDYMRS